jgi:hypothetical protein
MFFGILKEVFLKINFTLFYSPFNYAEKSFDVPCARQTVRAKTQGRRPVTRACCGQYPPTEHVRKTIGSIKVS